MAKESTSSFKQPSLSKTRFHSPENNLGTLVFLETHLERGPSGRRRPASRPASSRESRLGRSKVKTGRPRFRHKRVRVLKSRSNPFNDGYAARTSARMPRVTWSRTLTWLFIPNPFGWGNPSHGYSSLPTLLKRRLRKLHRAN